MAIECKFCQKPHIVSEEHDYVGRCRLQGCTACEKTYKRHCRVRDSARVAGVKLTKDDPQDFATQCVDCRVPAYEAHFGLTRGWIWLQEPDAQGGPQWSIEAAEAVRPEAKCPRCRKAKAA